MSSIRIWRSGVLAPDDDIRAASTEQVAAAVAEAGRPDTMVWLDVTPQQLPDVAQALGFNQHAVEDAVKPAEVGNEVVQRTKLDRFPGHVFLYLYTSALDATGLLQLRELPVFVRRDAIITVDRAGAVDPAGLLDRWDAHPELIKHGVTALLYGILDLVVDSHLEAVDRLGDLVDQMEDDLFDGSAEEDPTEIARRGFATRKSLVRMRRVSAPMRETISSVMRVEEDDHTPIPPVLMPYFQDVYDHVLRVSDSVEGMRDLITTIYETRLTKADHALNTVMRKLAGWAAIIAVPTAVTGFYGQNVPYPGFLKPWGFWVSTAVWVLLSTGLLVGLRRRRWI